MPGRFKYAEPEWCGYSGVQAARRSGIGCGDVRWLRAGSVGGVDVGAADVAGVDTHFDGFFSDVRVGCAA